MSVGPSRLVVWLVLAAIACRGVGYALLTPTYEGWDEYQHLAYFKAFEPGPPLPIGFGLTIPGLGVSYVSNEILEDLTRYPVPKALAEQIPELRLRTYVEFWTNETPQAGGNARVMLYEAQHPPWYYLLNEPFSRGIGASPESDITSFTAVRSVRFANLGWTLSAVWCVARVLKYCNVGRKTAEAVLVLLAVHSLFLMTSVRVCNDAMAFAFAFAAITRLASASTASHAAIAGVLLGLAGAVKATAWTVFPAALVFCVFRSRWTSTLSFLVFFCLIACVSMAYEVHRQGRFAPTQEAFVLAERGEGIGAVLRAATEINWFDEFSRRWGRQLLWVGGWSFAPLPKLLPRLHQWLLVASIFPLVIRLVRGGPRDWGFAAFCVLACLGVAAGQAIHMAQSKAALGFVATPAWYAVIALPWLFAGFAWSWNIDERLRRFATATFFTLLLVSEAIGVFFVWLPTFADSHDPALVIERCSILAGGQMYFSVGAVGFLAGWIAAVFALRIALKKETA